MDCQRTMLRGKNNPKDTWYDCIYTLAGKNEMVGMGGRLMGARIKERGRRWVSVAL